MLPHRSTIACVALLGLSLAHAADLCQVESGPATAALIELYTSEGCSSCPPADDALRAIHRHADPLAAVIPLALHVTYWNQISWNDRFAQGAFDNRQRTLVATGGGKVTYTPQFFVNGRELRNWRAALPDAIAQINHRPAAADIVLKSTQPRTGVMSLDALASTRIPGRRLALFAALSESELVSHVTGGENSGATLRHDDTVRHWIGPVPFVGGKAAIHQEIMLAPTWNPAHLRTVSFVQDLDAGDILQAVSTAPCALPARR